MNLFEQLGKAAASNLIKQAGLMESLPEPAQRALVQGGIGALLGGALGGVKGLIAPDEEVDSDGQPTGKRKGRLASALRNGLIGAGVGGGVGAIRGGVRGYFDSKRKQMLPPSLGGSNPNPIPAPRPTDAPKPSAPSGKPKTKLQEAREKGGPVIINRPKSDNTDNFDAKRRDAELDARMDKDIAAATKGIPRFTNESLDTIKKQQAKHIESLQYLLGESQRPDGNASRSPQEYKQLLEKAKDDFKQIENWQNSPSTSLMLHQQLLLDKAIRNAGPNTFVGHNYDKKTKLPKDYLLAYPKDGKPLNNLPAWMDSNYGFSPKTKEIALAQNEVGNLFAYPQTQEAQNKLELILDRLREPSERKFDYYTDYR
jgi:hypothetical protein